MMEGARNEPNGIVQPGAALFAAGAFLSSRAVCGRMRPMRGKAGMARILDKAPGATFGIRLSPWL